MRAPPKQQTKPDYLNTITAISVADGEAGQVMKTSTPLAANKTLDRAHTIT